jgi:hypothetical protein
VIPEDFQVLKISDASPGLLYELRAYALQPEAVFNRGSYRLAAGSSE